eukprot:4107220-Prymnesium_polylepis.2
MESHRTCSLLSCLTLVSGDDSSTSVSRFASASVAASCYSCRGCLPTPPPATGTARKQRHSPHVPPILRMRRSAHLDLLPALAVQLRVHLMAARTVLNSHESRYSLPSLSNKVKTASNACLSVGFCFNLFKTLVRC